MFSPSITPGFETVFLVEDNLGSKFGRIWSETNVDRADRASVLEDLYLGEYRDPLRVIAFNTAEGWSRDVSHEFAEELQRRADLDRRELTGTLAEFVNDYTRSGRQLSLWLAI